MRLLIVAAVAALTAIVTVFLLDQVHASWSSNSSIRTAIVGAVAGVVSVVVSRNLRRKD